MSSEQWLALRKPFGEDEIELLPKYTGKKDAGGRIPREAYRQCSECGKYHPFPCVHLTYVGHAGITMRLNDVDNEWNWEPVATDERGLPLITPDGMWIKLTVLGVTRYGFGDAQGKHGANAIKEIIGDAIRNAAMRFGVGTYLWSKSEKAEHLLDFSEAEADGEGDKPPSGGQGGEKPDASGRAGGKNADSERFARIKELKKEAVALGIKAEGIDSWCDTTFVLSNGSPKPRKNYTAQDIKSVEEHIKGLVADKHKLNTEKEKNDVDQPSVD